MREKEIIHLCFILIERKANFDLVLWSDERVSRQAHKPSLPSPTPIYP